MAEAPTASARFHFSEEQRKVLAEYYENGMHSTAKRYEASIQECARQVGCAIEQVKVLALAIVPCPLYAVDHWCTYGVDACEVCGCGLLVVVYPPSLALV